jgi:hypothetical protein
MLVPSHRIQSSLPLIARRLDLLLRVRPHGAVALEALHEGLDSVEVARLQDGGVVVAVLDGLPDLGRGLAELVEFAHVTRPGGCVLVIGLEARRWLSGEVCV